MSSFSYIARTTDGTMEKGTIEAETIDDAREKLRKRQLMAEELQREGSTAAAIGFSGAMPWTNTDEEPAMASTMAEPEMAVSGDYIPLIDTLRLFAGWLLAWYGVVFGIGSYTVSGKLPFEIPFIEGLFYSTLILRFAFATFLFLLLTSIHHWMGRGTGKGIALGVIGIVLFGAFHWLA